MVYKASGKGFTSISAVKVRIDNASLASLATGPALSDLEMSAAGRTWPDVGPLTAAPQATPAADGNMPAATTRPGMAAAQPSTGGFIQADPATNSLVITAPEPLYRQIRQLIDKLDTRRAQVYIESMIVEVSPSDSADFGFQWQGLLGQAGDKVGYVAGTNFGASGRPSAQPDDAGQRRGEDRGGRKRALHHRPVHRRRGRWQHGRRQPFPDHRAQGRRHHAAHSSASGRRGCGSHDHLLRDAGSANSLSLDRYDAMRGEQKTAQPERGWVLPITKRPLCRSCHPCARCKRASVPVCRPPWAACGRRALRHHRPSQGG